MRKPFVVLAVLCFIPSWASEPGQPLDCSDWVFLEPGLSCAHVGQCPPEGGTELEAWCHEDSYPGAVADNSGRFLQVRRRVLEQVECPDGSGASFFLYRVELLALDGSGKEHLIAYVDNRCGDFLTSDSISQPDANRSSLIFDEEHGRLLLPVLTDCINANPNNCTYGVMFQILRINGFTTTFEILQTFEPTPGPISFRVPYMPEGFQAADHFDTYYGDITTVGDWSQAQSLQCGYPAAAPSVGDYLTVADTLPELKPGEGRYFVTAVTHQGETRYGRKSSGAVLTGRDPAVLPGCSE